MQARRVLPILGLLALAFIIPSAARATIVEWPIAQGGNGHSYEIVFVPQEISWDAANIEAITRGGHLATVGTEAENLFIFSLAVNSSYWSVGRGDRSVGPWLGGFQRTGSSEPDAGWEWITGEPFLYTNWSPGEPNNWGGAENYLSFYSPIPNSMESVWNDIPDFDPPYSPKAYIVEYVPEPSSLALLSLGIAGLIGCGWGRYRQ